MLLFSPRFDGGESPTDLVIAEALASQARRESKTSAYALRFGIYRSVTVPSNTSAAMAMLSDNVGCG